MRASTKRAFPAVLAAVLALGLTACKKPAGAPETNTTEQGSPTMSITKAPFGRLADGTAVDIYTLTNKAGLEARITTYGAILVSLKVPDRNGVLADVNLGFDTLEGYLGTHPYFGAIIGRYGNRIAKARFTLDGVEYRLAANNNGNTLHGGIKGFDKVVWTAEPVNTAHGTGVKLTYLSKDMEEGFPGNLSVTVVYTLTDSNELEIRYDATTDKKTVLNLTNHAYWNLKGEGRGDILGHVLQIEADRFTAVDSPVNLIPTGEILAVAGTPFDFTSPRAIGERIAQVEGGYDHDFVLRRGGGTLILAARVEEPESGRAMEVWTDQPGIQLYTGNFLDGTVVGKGGKAYQKHFAFCLETQHFPDSPNHPNFPSTVLRPGEVYRTVSAYKFSVGVPITK
jgi:aldose 1-epimerase